MSRRSSDIHELRRAFGHLLIINLTVNGCQMLTILSWVGPSVLSCFYNKTICENYTLLLFNNNFKVF